MIVQNFMEIVRTVFDKFEIFMKGQEKKNDTIVSVVENFFRLLKNDGRCTQLNGSACMHFVMFRINNNSFDVN